MPSAVIPPVNEANSDEIFYSLVFQVLFNASPAHSSLIGQLGSSITNQRRFNVILCFDAAVVRQRSHDRPQSNFVIVLFGRWSGGPQFCKLEPPSNAV
jgi:hypothetical protein